MNQMPHYMHICTKIFVKRSSRAVEMSTLPFLSILGFNWNNRIKLSNYTLKKIHDNNITP